MTLHAGYAACRIRPKLRGRTKQFGWLQVSATKRTDFVCDVGVSCAEACVAKTTDSKNVTLALPVEPIDM
jgi:hypothetical protein